MIGYKLLSLTSIIRLLPLRILRLVLHIFPIAKHPYKIRVTGFKDWILDLPIYLIELFGLYELIFFLLIVIRPKIRKLTLEEQILVQEMFFESIDVDQIWINESAYWFTRKFAYAFVFGNIINYDNSITESVLVHECVHVGQYQQFGLVYISRALRAQFSEEGYDYGGTFGAAKAIAGGKHFIEFNFEQQAQIIEDYYEIKNRVDLMLNPMILNTYSLLHRQMLETFMSNGK